MQLVTNHGALTHRTAIAHVLEGATDATISVAFLKTGGARFIEPLLEGVLVRGGRALVLIGTDFFLTEPDALAILLGLAKRQPDCEIHIGRRASATFHPKVYTGADNRGFRCVVGSANLTGGALGANEEMSLLVETDKNSALELSLQAEFRRLRLGGRFQRLDRLVLDQYRGRYKPVEAPRAELDETIVAVDEALFDLDRLEALLGRYRASVDAMTDLGARGGNRLEARKVQDSIAAMSTTERLSTADREIFQDRLSDLMTGKDNSRHLWPSDAIFRQGTKTLKSPRKMIELFRLGEHAATLPPAEGFNLMRKAAQKIPGAGVNMITEILTTFAPDRYAVLNGNTRAALESLGFECPKTLTVGGLSGERYAVVGATIAALRDRIGARDFPETDAFLNWLYQQL